MVALYTLVSAFFDKHASSVVSHRVVVELGCYVDGSHSHPWPTSACLGNAAVFLECQQKEPQKANQLKILTSISVLLK